MCTFFCRFVYIYFQFLFFLSHWFLGGKNVSTFISLLQQYDFSNREKLNGCRFYFFNEGVKIFHWSFSDFYITLLDKIELQHDFTPVRWIYQQNKFELLQTENFWYKRSKKFHILNKISQMNGLVCWVSYRQLFISLEWKINPDISVDFSKLPRCL